MFRFGLVVLSAAVIVVGCGTDQSQAQLQLKRIGTFASPVHVTAPPRDRARVFVVEQGGRIRVVKNGKRLSRPFLDVSGKISSGGEQGLLSMAFAPDYATSGLFYIYYTNRDGDTRVMGYRRGTSGDMADPNSARQVLAVKQPESNHNGGMIAFGPDKLLYVALGDGGGAGDQHGSRGNAQDLGSMLGKILRIDPRPSGGRAYGIPGTNPFVARAGARPEIFSYGLRNPWRFSFDRANGNLTIGDVGQSAVEEVDFLSLKRAKGANFGWRVWEGTRRYSAGESAPGHVRPVLVRSHDDGWCSITGGVVVRDPALTTLKGRYVFGDYCKGEIESVRLVLPGKAVESKKTRLKVESLSSFGEDARGRVYAASLSGPVYRIAQ